MTSTDSNSPADAHQDMPFPPLYLFAPVIPLDDPRVSDPAPPHSRLSMMAAKGSAWRSAHKPTAQRNASRMHCHTLCRRPPICLKVGSPFAMVDTAGHKARGTARA